MQRQKNMPIRLLWTAALACIGWWFLVTNAVCGQQAGETAQDQASSKRVVVDAGDLRMVLEKVQQGLRVLSLTDKASGQELLANDPLPLFSATLRDAKTKELLTITADSGWGQVDVSDGAAAGSHRLTFAAPVDDRLKGIRVEVALAPQRNENAVTWDLQVANDSPQWGLWWTEGYWTMLSAIRSAKPADGMITTECNAEPYIKWFDGYLTWHWQEQNMVPAFSAVYGGAIQMFGRAYRGGPSQDLAHRMKAGQQLVFGEQIGWFGPEVIERPDCGKFLRDCIQLRWRLKEYFYRGRMARPPKLTAQVPTVTADWQWHGQWPITTDAVMTGAWQLPKENKVVLLFANVSDSPCTFRLEFDPRDYTLPDKSLAVTTMAPDGMKSTHKIQATDPPEIELAARSILAWEIAPVNDPVIP
jgi:hypothetical protein